MSDKQIIEWFMGHGMCDVTAREAMKLVRIESEKTCVRSTRKAAQSILETWQEG
jgi:hypothetical protein